MGFWFSKDPSFEPNNHHDGRTQRCMRPPTSDRSQHGGNLYVNGTRGTLETQLQEKKIKPRLDSLVVKYPYLGDGLKSKSKSEWLGPGPLG